MVRRRVEVPKRLKLFATLNLVGPALGRITLFYLAPALLTAFAIGIGIVLVLMPIAYDLATRRLGGAATIVAPRKPSSSVSPEDVAGMLATLLESGKE